MIPCLSKTEKYLSHQIINIAIVHTFSFWWVTQGRFSMAKGSVEIPKGYSGTASRCAESEVANDYLFVHRGEGPRGE